MAPNQPTPQQLSKRVQMARYVVYVDHQAKSSFDKQEAAEKEAKRILDAFPILAVRVADSHIDSVTQLGPTHEPVDPEEADAS